MLFSQMTKEQKEEALKAGNVVKYVGQGTFQKGTILQSDGLDVELEWDGGQRDWVSINAFGPAWKLVS